MKLTARQKRHRRYLQSDHWLLLSSCALIRDQRKCVKCGSGDGLNVHHKVYRERLEDGVLEDVVTLCRTCHRIVHGLCVRTPFEQLHSKLMRRINMSEESNLQLPSHSDLVTLAGLIADGDDEWNFEAMLRLVARMRVKSRFWTTWLAKKDLTPKLFTWAFNRRQILQSEVAL